jgi:tyrosyl-tRNA synthetase
MMPLLAGTDGVQKMSKSLNNYIGVAEPPAEQYGKVMSLPDSLILTYFELVTDVPEKELADMRRALEAQSVNPMELKKRLAREIVAQFHGPKEARQAEEQFARVFQKREAPEEMATVALPLGAGGAEVDIVAVIVQGHAAPSRSEARRLLAQGAVEVDGQRVTAPQERVRDGSIIKVGKRRFVRVVRG